MAAERLLTPNDTAFLVAETDVTPQVTAMLTLFNRTPDLERLKTAVRRGVEDLPRMRSVLNQQRSTLVPLPKLDIDRHVKPVYRPDITNREQLLEIVGKLHSEPLPREHPLWQVLLISNRHPDTQELPAGATERAAILWRLHHALGDGVSSMALLQSIMSDKPAPASDVRQTELPVVASSRTTIREHLRRAAGVGQVIARTSRLSPVPSPLNGRNTSQRRLTPLELDRAALRKIMRGYGVSVHDVVLALLTSVLRRYHQHHGAATDRDLVVIVPHNSQPIPRHGVQNNSVALLWVRLPITEADPVERLRRTAHSLGQSKREGWIEFSEVFPHIISRMPVSLQRKSFTRASVLTNAVCTIMPSRIHELEIEGQSAKESYVAAPLLETHGASFTFMAGGRAISGALVSDPGIIPDPFLIASFLEEAQRELTV